MSVRIFLDNAPEFYTNLDFIAGRILLTLTRPEHISGIVIKLEGESNTALTIPINALPGRYPSSKSGPGETLSEGHKILYKVKQVFPNNNSSYGASATLQAGPHQFPFEFKFPLNNICGNPEEMAKLGGVVGIGGFGSGGVRVMDGSKQLMYDHVLRTLPPSLTGFPRQAEIRYYVKVTIQRPGLFKENWRYKQGLKFLPIEPPRSKPTNQEVFARRPFTFKPRTPAPVPKQRSGFFGGRHKEASSGADRIPPGVEISARVPHPAILTCNQPIPLRLVAKKLVDSPEPIYISSLEINLIGKTRVRSYDLTNVEVSRWVVCSQSGLFIPVGNPGDKVGTETSLPDDLWKAVPLPNTVTPSFLTCNLQRTYGMELKLGLSWGRGNIQGGLRHSSTEEQLVQQSIYLPLIFSKIEVHSGIKPPAALLTAVNERPPRPRPQPQQQSQPQQQPTSAHSPSNFNHNVPPLPVRPPISAVQSGTAGGTQLPQPTVDPLFPPQLGTPQAALYSDAPPSYDDVMAEGMAGAGVADGDRPAYSGQTNENAPSLIPHPEGEGERAKGA